MSSAPEIKALEDAGLLGKSPRSYTLTAVNLNEGAWLLSEEVERLDNTAPDVQGAQEVAVAIESSDDASFEVEVLFKDEADNVKFRVDPSIDSDLSSTSPSGGNAYVYVTVRLASRFVDVEVTNTSGGTNKVSGSINFH